MINNLARWIWTKNKEQADEYACFLQGFRYQAGQITLKICADTDYAVSFNGKTVARGQYPNRKEVKYYDTIDLTEFCVLGENELKIIARYEGRDTSTHINDGAGVIFSLERNGEQIAYSCNQTLGGLSGEYAQYVNRQITCQLGLSVNSVYGGTTEYAPCREVEKSYNLLPRPVQKCRELAKARASRMKSRFELYDLGRETAGYLFLTVACKQECKLTVAYGEHLADGRVRKEIGDRDFSCDFYCKEGENVFDVPFLRVAGRYLEVICDGDVCVSEVGVTPSEYPVTHIAPPQQLSKEDKRIYEVCVRTLHLCMHEHYEDCPWREQAMYVVDTRNQMLCGYYAFREYQFARANLLFMSKGRMESGLLELTFPAVHTPSIPFFSLVYPVSVYEYVAYSKDESVLAETMDACEGIVNAFLARMDENRLIANFPQPYWNFYEWSEGSDGDDNRLNEDGSCPKKYDLILNCAFVWAMERYEALCRLTGREVDYQREKHLAAIHEAFYDEERDLYCASSAQKGLYTQLGNAFALLVGLGNDNTVKKVCECNGLVPATLSMMGYVYDALLQKDPSYAQFVLTDIRKKYRAMLDMGATSFWETEKGEADFGGAGSLCHGWSAMPAYYYHRFIELGIYTA